MLTLLAILLNSLPGFVIIVGGLRARKEHKSEVESKGTTLETQRQKVEYLFYLTTGVALLLLGNNGRMIVGVEPAVIPSIPVLNMALLGFVALSSLVSAFFLGRIHSKARRQAGTSRAFMKKLRLDAFLAIVVAILCILTLWRLRL